MPEECRFEWDSEDPLGSLREIFGWLMDGLDSEAVIWCGRRVVEEQSRALDKVNSSESTDDQLLYLAMAYGFGRVNTLLLRQTCNHGLKFEDCELCVRSKVHRS